MSGLPLRDYQDAAITAVRADYRSGVRRPLIGLPTGGGKTVVFGTMAARAHAKSGWRILILAHRDELIEQAVAKLLMIRPDLAMYTGIVKASRNEWQRDVVAASVQSLHARRLAEIPRDQYNMVICDEAHHAAADSYLRIFRWFGALPALTCRKCGGDGETAPAKDPEGAPVLCEACGGTGWEQQIPPAEHDPPLLLGVTATPERADGKHLADVWEKVSYHRSILEMVAEGYLCDAKGIACRLETLDLDDVKQSRGDFQDGALGEAMEQAEAPRHAVEVYTEHAKGRPAIVFTPTVALSEQMAEAFRGAGYAAEHLDGTTPKDERRAILARLASGETLIVSNCGVLTEGFDEPSVACIIMARPTKSKILYVQCVGRGLRLHPSKSSTRNAGAEYSPGCLVIDLMGNTARHSLVSVPRLMADGLDEQIALEAEAEGLSIIEAIERQAEAVRSGRLVAQMVDLFKSRPTNWQQVDAAMWTLGGQIVALQGADMTWSVQVREALADRSGPLRVAAHGLSLEYAMGVGEDEARKLDLGRLIDPDAGWRRRDASEKQRNALYALGEKKLSRQAGLSAGEASDALDVAIARKSMKNGGVR